VVEWSSRLARFGRMDDFIVSFLGEGTRLLPIICASAGVWLLVQKLTVPVAHRIFPSYVASVRAVAMAKATEKQKKTEARGGGGELQQQQHNNKEIGLVAASAALDDLSIRCTAMIFSCVASYGAMKLTLNPPPNFEQDLFFASSPQSSFYCAVAAGYFLWDLPVCLTRGYGAGFLVHAVGALGAELITLQPVCQPVMSWAHLFELSTPFLNARLMMIASGHTKSALFRICEMSFFLVFFATRIAYGLPKSWDFISRTFRDVFGGASSLAAIGGARSVTLALTACGISSVMCVLNAYWFAKIVKVGFGLQGRSTKAKKP